jgi:hypothetical protein
MQRMLRSSSMDSSCTTILVCPYLRMRHPIGPARGNWEGKHMAAMWRAVRWAWSTGCATEAPAARERSSSLRRRMRKEGGGGVVGAPEVAGASGCLKGHGGVGGGALLEGGGGEGGRVGIGGRGVAEGVEGGLLLIVKARRLLLLMVICVWKEVSGRCEGGSGGRAGERQEELRRGKVAVSDRGSALQVKVLLLLLLLLLRLRLLLLTVFDRARTQRSRRAKVRLLMLQNVGLIMILLLLLSLQSTLKKVRLLLRLLLLRQILTQCPVQAESKPGTDLLMLLLACREALGILGGRASATRRDCAGGWG